MSHRTAEKLSKESGLTIEWNASGGYYVLSHKESRMFPIYCKNRLMRIIEGITVTSKEGDDNV